MNIKVQCNNCNSETNHKVAAEHKTEGIYDVNDDFEIHWGGKYQIIECLGCNSISFKKETWHSEDYDPRTGMPEINEEIYPEREGSSTRELAFKTLEIPIDVARIYEETIKAINSKLHLISAIGLRTLVEAICIDQERNEKDLEKKIDGLVIMGLLSKEQAKFLHKLRFLGNIATHEITPPTGRELVAAIEIIETLIKTIYILPHLDKEIKTKKKPSAKKTKS